jgi:hypothetical protein
MARPVLYAGLAALIGAAPALAQEYTRFEPLVVTPAARPGEPEGCAAIALLNLPSAWRDGDAAVVMLAPWRTPDPARDRVVAALLQEQAAVLELSIGPCPAPDGTAAAAAPLAEALGALDALRRHAGAGVVVAIGYGPGAREMLAAVDEAEAQARLGASGPRFAAAAALGEGAPAFARGAAQAPREMAPVRLGLLCDALGSAAGALAEALRGPPEAVALGCRHALDGAPPAGAASSRGIPPVTITEAPR